jgi:hypothetical protein
MVILLIVAIVAAIAAMPTTVAISTALLKLAQPKSRAGAAMCFSAAAAAVVIAAVVLCSSASVFRYSADGPVIWFLIFASVSGALVGLIGAAFAVAAIRRRLIYGDSRAAMTSI